MLSRKVDNQLLRKMSVWLIQQYYQLNFSSIVIQYFDF